MLLLTTAALPQLDQHRHPNLGRLITPRHYPRLAETLESYLVAADNDCLLIRAGPCQASVESRRLVRGRCCARAPGLTSVHDPRVGSGAGDKMFDGVIPLGEALRPLNLSRRYTRVACRQQSFGSWPRRIGVSEGLARAKGWKLVVGGSGPAGTGRCTAQPKPGSSGQSTGGVGCCRRAGRARAAA